MLIQLSNFKPQERSFAPELENNKRNKRIWNSVACGSQARLTLVLSARATSAASRLLFGASTGLVHGGHGFCFRRPRILFIYRKAFFINFSCATDAGVYVFSAFMFCPRKFSYRQMQPEARPFGWVVFNVLHGTDLWEEAGFS